MASKEITNEQVADVLDKAVALMNNEGAHWLKGQFRLTVDKETSYCAIGGIQAAAPGEANRRLRDRAVFALVEDIPSEQFPSSTYLRTKEAWARAKVMAWNDSHRTQWTDIKKVFTAASKRLRKVK